MGYQKPKKVYMRTDILNCALIEDHAKRRIFLLFVQASSYWEYLPADSSKHMILETACGFKSFLLSRALVLAFCFDIITLVHLS